MAKANKSQDTLSTSAPAVDRPIASLIVAWVKPHLPSTTHPAIDAALAALIGEQDGFVRNGNRTDYRRDKLAFASSAVEVTKDGPVLVYSTMQGRRVDEIVYAFLFWASSYVFPATKREDGKFQHHTPARERWCESLGFSKVEAGKGKRLTITKDGIEELRAAIAALVPERFEGTEAPESTKAQVKFNLPSTLGSYSVSISLYDPSQPSVNEEKFRADLAKVRVMIDGGMTFGLSKKGEMNNVAQAYSAALLAAQPQQEEAAAVA